MSQPELSESEDPSDGSSSSTASASSAVKLQRSLKLHHAVAMITGCIVGSGIFITPTGVLSEVGSPGASLIIWLFCGIISTIGAYCYCELGTMISESGGDYAYIKNSLGKFMSFLCLWGYVMVVCPAGNSATALTFAKYTIYPFLQDCVDEGFAVTVIAIAIVCLLTAMNCMNVNWANNAQVVFTIAKVLPLAVVIIAGFVQLGMTKSLGSFADLWANTPHDPEKFALGFYQGMFSFSGWTTLNFLVEEIHNPEKNLPRAVFISLPLVTIVYLLANCAYFLVLSVPEILSSSAVAITFTKGRFFTGLHFLIAVFVATATISSINGLIYVTSRLLFVGSRDSLMPDFLSLINVKRKTPIPALIFQCLITVLYLIIGGREIEKLINFASFSELSFNGLALLGMVILKWRQPKLPRPIRVHVAFPIIMLLFLVYLLFAPLLEDSKDKVLIGFLIIISGAPFYIVCFVVLRKSRLVKSTLFRVTFFVQKLFVCVPETLEASTTPASNVRDEIPETSASPTTEIPKNFQPIDHGSQSLLQRSKSNVKQ